MRPAPGTVQGAVATWCLCRRCPRSHQVATAPCTASRRTQLKTAILHQSGTGCGQIGSENRCAEATVSAFNPAERSRFFVRCILCRRKSSRRTFHARGGQSQIAKFEWQVNEDRRHRAHREIPGGGRLVDYGTNDLCQRRLSDPLKAQWH